MAKRFSKYEQERIVKFYERQLLNRIIQSDKYINLTYRNFIKSTSEIMSKYRSNPMGVVYRNRELDSQLNAEINKLSENLETSIRNNQKYAWQLADTKNDAIVKRLTQNLAISNIAREGLMSRNEEALLQFAKRKINGMNLSDRVWNLKQSSKEVLENYLETGITVGRSADAISRDIKMALNEPDRLFGYIKEGKIGKIDPKDINKEYKPGRGVYRSSYKNARRLAATETNMAYRASDHERWKNSKIVIGFDVKLSNNHTLNGQPFVDICDDLVGRYPKTFKFVGWHPLCRCYAVPVLPNEDSIMEYIMGDDSNIKNVDTMPSGFTDWLSRNGSKLENWKTQPFFVRDNFVGGRIENGLKKNVVKK